MEYFLFIRTTELFWSIIVGMMLIAGCNSEDQSSNTTDIDHISLEKNLTISAGTEKVLVGNFAGLAINDDGNIYVADTKLQKIHIFSPDGEYLDSLGRKGKGPGEFADINPRIRIQLDTLYVLQNNARRIDLFNLKSNESFRTISIPDVKINNMPIGDSQNLFPISNGNLFISFVNPYFTAPKEDEQPHKVTISKLDPSGKFVNKKILQMPVPYPTDQKVVYLESGAISVFTTLFYPDLKIAAGPDGDLFIGKSDSLLLRSYDENGRKLNRLEGKKTPSLFTDSDFDSVAQSKGEKFEKAINQVGRPNHWPAFQNFLIDNKGRCWIKLLDPGATLQTWWVFNTEGILKWKFKLPAEVELYEIIDNKAYGISNPPENVPSIIRYSIDI